MGSFLSSTMNESMKKNQEFMLSTQKMQFERQMAMQKVMMERQMAIQLGRAKDMFNWLAAFTGTYTVIAVAGFTKRGKAALFVPLLPLSFALAFQADLAYGNKLHRIRDEAERLLASDCALLQLPGGGMPTIEELDKKARKN